MSWYSKYLTVFEKPLSAIPEHIIAEVRSKIERLQCDNPIATVAVIGYNEETRLSSCLWSLSENLCDYPVEIIGVNNNSTDRTGEVFDALGVKCYMEEKKSCGYARRCGLENARGKYYICIDADTMYPPGYLQTFIKELQKPGIVGVSSLWTFLTDKRTSKMGLFIYEQMRNIHLRLLSYKSPELSVRGMTFAYIAEYGRKVGYRVDIKRGEDGSMALGLKKYGNLKLLTSRKVRVVTCSNTFNAKGSLSDNFKIEIKKAMKGVKHYFIKKDNYSDQESNLIQPTHSNNPE